MLKSSRRPTRRRTEPQDRRIDPDGRSALVDPSAIAACRGSWRSMQKDVGQSNLASRMHKDWAMPRKICKIGAAIVAGACVSGFAAPRAQATGYWNVTGNFCQCWGYGWGAGYHSCLVLGPPSCAGFLNPHEVRLICPPGPPCGCSYGSSCDCANSGQSVIEPSTLSATDRQPPPAAFLPQVQR